MPAFSWSFVGPHVLLLRFTHSPHRPAQIQRLSDLIHKAPPPEVLDCIPGYDTLLVEFSPLPAAWINRIAECWRTQLEAPATEANTSPPGRLHQIPVRYDGPDLSRVADQAKLPVSEIIRLHQSQIYLVHMIGFCPGFPYLLGLPNSIHTPRLPSPRPSVPAGSVAIGGEFTGVYPIERPGGWNLIGSTSTPLFTPEKALGSNPSQAILLHPGDRVQFIPHSCN